MNNKKNTKSLLTTCLSPLLLTAFLTACGGLNHPNYEGHTDLSTGAGETYESIGSFVLNPCTGTYLGDGIGMTSAHCFEKGMSEAGVASIPSIGFHCAVGEQPSKETCGVVADITEIAIPEGYLSSSQEQPGSDFALFRIQGQNLPKARFSLSSTFNVGPVARMGYGSKGLTGDLSCSILPTSKFPENDAEKAAATYHIRTDCDSIWGDSGGPLTDTQEGIIGISKGTRVIDGAVVETYAVPVTPALKEAIEQFKKGMLSGSTTVLPSGVSIKAFPYTPVPVSYK